MVRQGEARDLQDIVRMAREFWKHTIFDEEYDPYMVEAMAQNCMDQGLMAVLDIDDSVRGFACGVAGPLMASAEVLSGTEVAWWVDPEHRSGKNGIQLLIELEKMAKNQGVKYWSMIFMESSMPDKIEGIYQKMGYNKSETSYTTVI